MNKKARLNNIMVLTVVFGLVLYWSGFLDVLEEDAKVIPKPKEEETVQVKIVYEDAVVPHDVDITMVVPEYYVYELENDTITYRTDTFDVSNLNDLEILK